MNRLEGRKTAVVLALITVLAALFRFYDIGKLSLWGDELSTVRIASYRLEKLVTEINMDLYFALVHFWVGIFPDASDGLLRVPSALFSVASIPVVYLLGKSLGTSRLQASAIGLIAAGLVAVNAWHIQYAQELRSYSLLLLTGTLSTVVLIKAVERPEYPDWWVAYVAASAATVYSHLFGVLLFLGHAVSLLVLWRESNSTFPARRVFTSGVAIAALISPLAIASFVEGSESRLGWISEPTLHDVETFVAELSGNQGMALFGLYLSAAIMGFAVGINGRLESSDYPNRWKFTLMAASLVLPVASALVLSKLIVPVFVDRYLIYVMPYMAVLAAVGIVSLGSLNRFGLRYAPPIAAVSILTVIVLFSLAGTRQYFSEFEKEDFKGVARFLEDECPNGFLVFYPPGIEAKVAHYSEGIEFLELWEWKGRWEWKEKLGENPTAQRLTQTFPNDFERGCLILWHVNNQERRSQSDTIKSALRTEFSEMTSREFHGVEVEVYSNGD